MEDVDDDENFEQDSFRAISSHVFRNKYDLSMEYLVTSAE